jgi:hypothetical protein
LQLSSGEIAVGPSEASVGKSLRLPSLSRLRPPNQNRRSMGLPSSSLFFTGDG